MAFSRPLCVNGRCLSVDSQSTMLFALGDEPRLSFHTTRRNYGRNATRVRVSRDEFGSRKDRSCCSENAIGWCIWVGPCTSVQYLQLYCVYA